MNIETFYHPHNTRLFYPIVSNVKIIISTYDTYYDPQASVDKKSQREIADVAGVADVTIRQPSYFSFSDSSFFSVALFFL